MNAILGFAFVVLGFSASIFGAVGATVALVTGRHSLLPTVRRWAWLVVIAAVGAFVVMEVALFQRDYTLAYVATVGADDTPPLFNVAALWSSLEGSILLWTLVLAGYLAAMVIKFRKQHDDPLLGWALVVMLAVTGFFFAVMVGPANPFTTVEVPADFAGPGPNPLLQNHILVAFHPPMLYLGYVGFTVPFAFAIGALITGRLGEGWLVETRRWTVAAWGFLTFGIILGAWWSYEVLGWGGYWAWDPVENASILPWLTGTAYLHSVMVQERRGMLRVWNLSLLCATFSLTVLGTFLTRSGVIDSVHAFANGETVGVWFLGLFTAAAVSSIGLIAWRGDQLRSPGTIDHPVSREGAFLANNLVFGAMAFVVLLGTVFPLLAEAWNGDRLTIGRPYFESLGRPIGITLLFLMAAAPLLPWRKASTEVLSKRLFWPAVLGVGAMGLAVALGGRGFWAVLTFGLGGFAGGAALRQVVLAVRRTGWRGVVGRTNGGMVVHIGVVLLAVGLAASESYKSDRTVLLDVGEEVTIEGHRFRYVEPGADINDRRLRTYAVILVDGETIREPAITNYRRIGQIVGTPSVRTGVTEDLMLILDQMPSRDDDTIRLRVVIRPMVTWIWAGGGLMFLGTALALVPSAKGGRRRRALAGRGDDGDRTPAAASDPMTIEVDDEAAGDGPAEREPNERELVGG
ncbi:MAG: heme lyase CcmF/NrfE family subunit [Actinomycetota bacterium]